MSIEIEPTLNSLAIEPTLNSIEVSLVNVESIYNFVTPTLLDITHEEVG